MKDKKITFSQHALDQLEDRGTNKAEVIQAIREGERQIAKKGRIAFKKNFSFDKMWKGRYYSMKQVMPIVADEKGEHVVITVYVFFFGGKKFHGHRFFFRKLGAFLARFSIPPAGGEDNFLLSWTGDDHLHVFSREGGHDFHRVGIGELLL